MTDAFSPHAQSRLAQLVARLRDALRAADPRAPSEIIETHISIVLLAGKRAYKFKKPVRFDFVDFSSLAARYRYCEDELRLNARFGTDLYLRVVAITGDDLHPRIGGPGAAIEYAVEMCRFEQTALLDQQIGAGQVTTGDFSSLGSLLGKLHATAERAPRTSHYGRADLVRQQMDSVLSQLSAKCPISALIAREKVLFEQLAPNFQARTAAAAIRSCHGDLHLSNIVRIKGVLRPFDCIEFNDDLRWIDVFSDLAFLVMDLDVRGHGAAANTVLNAYLQETGDYAGLVVLPWYCLYRTLVRAMVAGLRVESEPVKNSASNAHVRRRDDHLELARGYARKRESPGLILTYGLSGSGKSWFATRLAAHCGYVHVRSDIERKRGAELDAQARTNSAVGDGLYAADRSAETYARLREVGASVLSSGHTVIIDATFLQRAWRDQFRDLAAKLKVPVHIITFELPYAVLRERIQRRQMRADDPSEATVDVLDWQLRTRDPIAADEQSICVDVAQLDLDQNKSAGLSRRLGCRRLESAPPALVTAI